jgi:hypothetical protein
VALLNAGLAGSFVTILLRSPWKAAFASVTIAALALYGWELAAILRARKRRPFDWGIRYFLTALALLPPLAMLALALSWPGLLPLNPLTGQLENLYGFLGLMGVVSLAVMGMLYKIIPFLVWFGVYSKHVGRARIPSLADLYSPRLQMAGYWCLLAAIVVTGAGILRGSESIVRCGSILFAGGVVTLAWNVWNMLAHLVRPRVTPLTPPRTASGIHA